MTTIARIQRYISRRRNRKRPVPYTQIAEEVMDRFGDGQHIFTPGQLSLIKDGKWDPQDMEIRNAYRLGPRTCPTCHQKIRRPRAPREPVELQDHQKWWRLALSRKERDDYIRDIYEDRI